MSIEARFRSKYEAHSASECWLWTGSLDSGGYGQIHHSGRRMVKAHRVSWELHHGPIPEGTMVLHRCDTPRCVNPGHLFLGTQLENMRDMMEKGRHVPATYQTPPERRARGLRNGAYTQPHRVPRGDRNGARTKPESRARGERCGSAKITEALVREIRRRHASGELQREIGAAFGLGQTQVSRIVRRQSWAHILDD